MGVLCPRLLLELGDAPTKFGDSHWAYPEQMPTLSVKLILQSPLVLSSHFLALPAGRTRVPTFQMILVLDSQHSIHPFQPWGCRGIALFIPLGLKVFTRSRTVVSTMQSTPDINRGKFKGDLPKQSAQFQAFLLLCRDFFLTSHHLASCGRLRLSLLVL